MAKIEGEAFAAVRLRPSQGRDLPAIHEIYAHHVRFGLASFELEPPTLAEMAARRETSLAADLPYLVADVDGETAGFAYAVLYNARPGYRFTVEDSVYLRPEFQGRGIGRRLLTRLLDDCTALGYRQMIAKIGDSGNAASIALHLALGFRRVGVLADVGFKHGRWVDAVLMQRALGPGASTLPSR